MDQRLTSLKNNEDIKNINKLKSEDINEKINWKEMEQASHPRGGGSCGSQTKCKSLFKILTNKKENWKWKIQMEKESAQQDRRS